MGKSTQAQMRATVDKILELLTHNPALRFTEISRMLNHNDDYVSLLYSRNTHGFRDRYDELLKQKFAELEGPAISALGDLVSEKHFNAIKYVLDNRGYKPIEKVEANIATDINITIAEWYLYVCGKKY